MSPTAIAENAADRAAGEPGSAGRAVRVLSRGGKRAGSWEALLNAALPLVVSQSFMTVQVFVDTILLSWHDQREMAATLPAIMWYWLPFGLLQVTAGYVSTFVAQYTGARRPERVGPAVWQGIHFAVLAGLLFLAMVPAAPYLIAIGGHTRTLQALEVTYLRCFSFAALPMLVMAAVNGFFSGRGQTWTVLGIEAAGTGLNVALALVLIFGRAGFPELGIAGAGWATVAGSWTSALVALALLFRRKYREAFNTLHGWVPERALFLRLMKYGGPAGAQVFLDVLVFHFFIQLVGRLGEAAAAACALTVRLNMVAFLPMMGMAQAVSILVGQRLEAQQTEPISLNGQPIRASNGSSWLYVAAWRPFTSPSPGALVGVFRGNSDTENFAAVAALVPSLLLCVAVYSVADSNNVTFSYALRGAGDTRFVSLLTFALAWPIMVVPTYVVVRSGGSLYWAWGFAAAYIIAMAVCFYLRFRTGRWKTMRVIEAAPAAFPG